MSRLEEQIATLIVKEVSAETVADYLLPNIRFDEDLKELGITREGFKVIQGLVASNVRQIIMRAK